MSTAKVSARYENFGFGSFHWRRVPQVIPGPDNLSSLLRNIYIYILYYIYAYPPTPAYAKAGAAPGIA